MRRGGVSSRSMHKRGVGVLVTGVIRALGRRADEVRKGRQASLEKGVCD